MKKKILLSIFGLSLVLVGCGRGPIVEKLEGPSLKEEVVIDTGYVGVNSGVVGFYSTGELLLGLSGVINQWHDFSSIPLDPILASQLSGKFFDIWDITTDKKIIYINITEPNTIGGYAIVLYNTGDKYVSIYQGQDSIPEGVRTQYNIPNTFHK
ncbi:hypothetical protein XF24_00025 [candidate division SR1 bacterium Aalborg_AAW-1]|nr:hypothetical protein XF24_00025 [candidate division SR1 bacterium Aalborg_AAW-1]